MLCQAERERSERNESYEGWRTGADITVEFKREAAPHPGRRFHLQARSHRVQQAFTQRQAQATAHAAPVPPTGSICRFHAAPGVAHIELDATLCFARATLNATALRVLESV